MHAHTSEYVAEWTGHGRSGSGLAAVDRLTWRVLLQAQVREMMYLVRIEEVQSLR